MPSFQRIPSLGEFLETRSATLRSPYSDEECPICLEVYYPTDMPASAHSSYTFLACSAGHTFHAPCLIADMLTSRGAGSIQNRCPICRLRLFAESDVISDMLDLLLEREEESRRLFASADPGLEAIIALSDDGEMLLFRPEEYQRVLNAWIMVDTAQNYPDFDRYTHAYDMAEEMASDLSRREEGF